MITIRDSKGALGTVSLAGGRLVGSNPVMQDLADSHLHSTGSLVTAYRKLSHLNNGYLWASGGVSLAGQTSGSVIELAMHVRTPAGERFFHKPIGALIEDHDLGKSYPEIRKITPRTGTAHAQITRAQKAEKAGKYHLAAAAMLEAKKQVPQKSAAWQALNDRQRSLAVLHVEGKAPPRGTESEISNVKGKIPPVDRHAERFNNPGFRKYPDTAAAANAQILPEPDETIRQQTAQQMLLAFTQKKILGALTDPPADMNPNQLKMATRIIDNITGVQVDNLAVDAGTVVPKQVAEHARNRIQALMEAIKIEGNSDAKKTLIVHLSMILGALGLTALSAGLGVPAGIAAIITTLPSMMQELSDFRNDYKRVRAGEIPPKLNKAVEEARKLAN